MAYYKRRIEAGAVVEIEKWQTIGMRGGKKLERAKKENPTPEAMFLINERNAAAKLRRKLNANFGPGDFHVILVYHKASLPSVEESRVRLEKFLRSLRGHFKARGRELKYIAVTEHPRGNIHHHIVIPACDIRVLSSLWTRIDRSHWRVKVFPLDDSGQYRQLADYLIKETSKTFRDGKGAYRKRWNESRNLVRPKETVKKIRAREWKRDPAPESGYRIERDTIDTGVNPFNGLIWQRYSMVRCRNDRKRKGGTRWQTEMERPAAGSAARG